MNGRNDTREIEDDGYETLYATGVDTEPKLCPRCHNEVLGDIDNECEICHGEGIIG